MPNNREVLESNKQAVLKFAGHIDYPTIPSVKDIETKQQAALEHVKNGEFTEAIKLLNEIKDNRLGIVWHESSDLGNGTRAVVRDARNVNIDVGPALLRKEAGEKYTMQVCNEVRAGFALIDQADLNDARKQDVKEKLNHIAIQAMRNPSQLNSANIKNYNTQILHVLADAGITDPAEKLLFAKEIMSFKDEHRHIVTLTTAVDMAGKKHTVIEADIMLNGLTKSQKQEYTVISNVSKGTKTGVKWFDAMPEYKQNLVREVAADIATGNKVIPAQLLKDLAGLRNAYQKVTAVQAEGRNPVVLAENFHCATPATKVKVDGKATQEIPDENVRQLQTFIPEGESLRLNTLTSRTPGNVRNENFVQNQLHKTSDSLPGVQVSSSPINMFRLLGGGRDNEAHKNNLIKLGGKIETSKKTENIGKFLKNGSSFFGNILESITFGAYKTTETKALAEILALDNHQLKADLITAMDVRNLIDSRTIFANSQNVNLDISIKMNLVNSSVKSGVLGNVLGEDFAKEYSHNVDFCKSGKDRTGYVMTKTTQHAVANYLGVNTQSQHGQANLLHQVVGGHTQEMAGIQGGTVGCHSLKTNPEFRLNREDEAIDGIIDQKSSHFNSNIKAHVKGSKKEAKAVSEFDVSYQKAQHAKTHGANLDLVKNEPDLKWQNNVLAERHTENSGVKGRI